jgi:hypothetical protein
MNCPRCGSPIPEEEKNLCPYCFYLLGSTEEPVKTPDEEESIGEESPYSLTMLPPIPSTEDEKDYETVDFFGLKLKLKKKGLAQILSMDVREVLTGNWQVVKRPKKGEEHIPTLARTATEEEVAEYLKWSGKELGFKVDGKFWQAEMGRKILVEPLLKDLSSEAADKLVKKLLASEQRLKEPVSVLLVVTNLNEAGILRAAVSHHQALHFINVIAFEDLRYLLALKQSNYLSHESIAQLLFPTMGLDIHQILSVVAEGIQAAKNLS